MEFIAVAVQGVPHSNKSIKWVKQVDRRLPGCEEGKQREVSKGVRGGNGQPGCLIGYTVEFGSAFLTYIPLPSKYFNYYNIL